MVVTFPPGNAVTGDARAHREGPASRHPTDRSAELFEEAKTLIPGGVNSPVRAFAAVGGTPLFISRGDGAYLWDVDGNRYVDYVMSWGPLVHGHAFPPVVEAVRTAAALGTSFGAPSPAEVRLARLVVDAVPSVESVRFVSSGTEAAMSAVRLARAWTGRDLIVKFAGNYHGHVDALLAQAGSGSLTLGVPSSPGVPGVVTAATMVARYNDSAAVETLFSEMGSNIAAVIVEPIAGNMGVVPPREGFLQALEDLTRRTGALLVLDEVITAFRVAAGGAQHVFDIHPDLTILGKIIGGGLPVGAYGGRRDIMDRVAPVGPVYQAGTLSGNPLAMAAGIASLETLRDGAFYRDLEQATARLAAGLRQAAKEEGVPITVNHCTGMLTVFFTDGPIHDLDDAQRSDVGLYAQFFQDMLEQGIYLPPSQFESWMLSSRHTPEIVDATLAGARSAFGRIARLN
ncbi:MAG TPA: glutamate-1-semialdehyde 2,1-aminomutase [Chloroflexota bacterium]